MYYAQTLTLRFVYLFRAIKLWIVNVNTLIGSLRDRLAEAVFSRNPLYRELKLLRIITEIQKSVVPIRPDDGKTPRYENPRKSKFHHNKKSNL